MGRPKVGRVWKHYRSGEGTDKSASCIYCDMKYKIGNVNKMAAHLLKCLKCPLDVKRELKNISAEQLSRNLLLEPPKQGLPSSSVVDSFSSESHLTFNSTLTFSEEQKSSLNEQLAKDIFVSGTPLSMVEHPLWIKFFEQLQPSYKMPTRKSISTSYLDKIYNEMRNELTVQLKSANYLHLQCDGWSNIRNEGIINFLISKPEPVFVKSLNTETNRHTSEYLAQEMLKIIKAYGEQKFVVLIGDNAKNMQKAFQIVKNTYPHVIPLGCVAHGLNLLCHDCIKCKSLHAFFLSVVDIIKTIKYSQILSALLIKIIKDKESGEKLKLPCKTRWGSYLSSLNSLKNSKAALQALAVHESVKLPPETKSKLLNEDFWEKINQSINIFKPITEWIFKLESNNCNINDVFKAFKNIKCKLQTVLPSISILRMEILSTFDKRVNKCVKPIHLAAYMLDPKAQGHELNATEEVDAMNFIFNMSQQLNLNVMPDLAKYKAREGLWGKEFVWTSIGDITPLTWWKGICGSTHLSKVAVRILTAPCTSAATERSFSIQSSIHSKKRNRLTAERAAKISYISYNWNLLHKYDESEEIVCEEISTDYLTTPDAEVHNDYAQIDDDPNQASTSSGHTHSLSLFSYYGAISDSDSD